MTFKPDGGSGWGHAVVIGAGIGGLLAGRVLAGHFDRVTIVERDVLPLGTTAVRKGVPQGRHLHSLASKGGEILERYFPGLDSELAAAGCPALDQTWDALTYTPAGRLPRFRSGIMMRAASRALLEERILRRLASNPNVRFLPGCEVVDLVAAGGSVVGARVRKRGARSEEETLTADLVVDASGQGSHAPRWLAELGYEAPEEEIVDARLGYASRWYRVPESHTEDWKGLAVLPGWPDNPRGGTLRRVEGDLWTASLIGIGDNYPPRGGEAFLEFARTLPSPAIHEAIKDAEPVSPVYRYHRTANRRRRYDKVRLPENFLVLGDAACLLNPSYGNGMTAVALASETLDGCLREQRRSPKGGLAGLGRGFQERQVTAVAPCWTMTTNSDRLWVASGIDELGLSRRIFHHTSEEVLALAVKREDVAQTLLEVKNLLKPPATLLRPGILLPALRRAILPILTSRSTAQIPQLQIGTLGILCGFL